MGKPVAGWQKRRAPGGSHEVVESGKRRKFATKATAGGLVGQGSAAVGHHPLLRSPLENRGKFPFSENRTPDRIPPAPALEAASQNALVGHSGLWIPPVSACPIAAAGPFQALRSLVPTSRLALVDSESSPLSPSLGAQSALANPSPTVFWVATLSPALPHYLAGLLLTVVDHPLASVRIFVLKLCSGS